MGGAFYSEWSPSPAARRHLACVWTAGFGDGGEPHTDRIIPDGCIDVVWTGGRLTVAGPDTRWTSVSAGAGATFAGIRFKPGAAPAILGVPASAIVDARADGADVLGTRALLLCERLAATASSVEAAREIESAVIAWLPASAPSNRLVEGAVAALRVGGGATPVARLAKALGASERQLNRGCVAAIGYGPKLLHRVLRLRRFLELAAAPSAPPLSALAFDAGYADQAHMTRDCRELTGLSPARLRGRRVTSG